MGTVLITCALSLLIGCLKVSGQDYCTDTRKYARCRLDPTGKTYDECLNNRWTVSTCKQGLIFHEGLQKCVLQGTYTCGGLPFQCPQPNGDFPDNSDCTRYYLCKNGSPLRRNCAAGDVFDPNNLRCVFQDGTISCSTSGSGSIFQCPSASGKFRNPSDSTCKGYYECSNYQATQRTCASNLVYYPGLDQCVLADSYRCPGGWSYQCPYSDGDFQDPTSANNYYHCIKGYPLLRRCPQGQVFDTQQVRCVQQGGSSTSRCNSAPQVSCASGQSGNYSDSTDCHYYFQCQNFQAVRVPCPNDWVYYAGLKKCVIRDSYNCYDQNPFNCPNPDEDFPDTNNCRRFYYCLGYCPLHRTCPAGQVYNGDPNVKRCVDQTTYSCPYPIQ